MRQRRRIVVLPSCRPVEGKDARTKGMAAALSCGLEKGTCCQTDSVPYETRSSAESGIQGETGNRARQSSCKKRRRQETPSHLRKTTKGNGCLKIYQKPLPPKNSRKTCQQKIRQSDTPRFVLPVFRRHSPLVRGNSRRQESSCARGMV